MKKLLLLLSLLLLSSCAVVFTKTSETPNPANTNMVLVTTKAKVITFFDSNSQVSKLSVRGETVRSNEWAQGTYIGNISQATTSTNVNALLANTLQALVQGIVAGAK